MHLQALIAESVVQKAGKRHPGTQRVKYDAVYEEEEEREKTPPPSPTPSFYDDEEYVRYQASVKPLLRLY